MTTALQSDWNAERIAKLREQLGFTRAQMAQKLGISRQAIRLWETSQRSPKSLAKRALQELEEQSTSAETCQQQ